MLRIGYTCFCRYTIEVIKKLRNRNKHYLFYFKEHAFNCAINFIEITKFNLQLKTFLYS